MDSTKQFEMFQKVVLSELAYVHAIVAAHKDFAMKMASHNKMTPNEEKLIADDVARKQQMVFADLCRRAGIVGPSSPLRE